MYVVHFIRIRVATKSETEGTKVEVIPTQEKKKETNDVQNRKHGRKTRKIK